MIDENNTELNALLDRASDLVSAKRARPDAIKAIRALEARLVAAGGLRGMHNLGSRDIEIFGMRVRSNMPDQRLPFEDKVTALVLTPHGSLVTVKIVAVSEGWPPWHAVIAPAADEDLQVEDVEHLIRVASLALTRHLAAVEGPTKKFRDLRELAHKLIDLL